MDWIPALLKHLGISRSVVGAAFATSAVLYAGPRVAPAYVDPVPKEWSAVLMGTLVFSACLLLFWGTSAAWLFATRRWAKVSALLASADLSQLEMDVLLALGEKPGEALNLDRIDYEALALSRLEVVQLMDGLAKKGLVHLNSYASDLVSLTSLGRERALDIQRLAKRDAA